MNTFPTRCCFRCKWFRKPHKKDKLTEQDKRYTYYCGIGLFGTNPDLLRCGGDDYFEEPSRAFSEFNEEEVA